MANSFNKDGDAAAAANSAFEQLSVPEIPGPFPARVRGVDVYQERFDVETAIDYISPCDFSLRLKRNIALFARLVAVAKIYKTRVILRGTVTLIEPQPDDSYCLTVTITRYRFLQ